MPEAILRCLRDERRGLAAAVEPAQRPRKGCTPRRHSRIGADALLEHRDDLVAAAFARAGVAELSAVHEYRVGLARLLADLERSLRQDERRCEVAAHELERRGWKGREPLERRLSDFTCDHLHTLE